MSREQFLIPRNSFVAPADERLQQPPPIFDELQGKTAEYLNKGMFFDVYTVDVPIVGEKQSKRYVVKDFRIGDAVMSPEEQISLFQDQYYEWNSLRGDVGAGFFPETYWLRSSAFSSDQAHGLYKEPGKSGNTTWEFVKLRVDRQLANRYGSEVTIGTAKKVMREIGAKLIPPERSHVGIVVQEYIHGESFGEIIQRLRPEDKQTPAFRLLQQAVSGLLVALQRAQEQDPLHVFSWDSLLSHNIMVETDAENRVTGRVFILDANGLRRPTETHRKVVIRRNQNIIHAIRQALDI